MLTIQKLGHEFLLSDPQGNQSSPIVAGLAGGGAIALFSEVDAAGWVPGLHDRLKLGQAIDSQGGRVGTGVPVLPAGEIAATSVLGLPDGGYVVTWNRFANPDDLAPDTVFRAYGADGQPVSGEVVQVDALSQILALPDGNLVRVWMREDVWSDPRESEVVAQVVRTDGTAVGGEIAVSGPVLGFINQFSAKSLADGSFAVTWELTPPLQDLGAPKVTLARVFDTDGVAKGSAIELFSAPSDGDGGFTDAVTGVELHTSGGDGFSVVWRPDITLDGSNPDDTGVDNGIRAQEFDSTGAKVGPERVIFPGALEHPAPPRITDLADGSHLVTRLVPTTSDPDAPGWQLSVQAFDGDWQVASAPVLLGPTSGSGSYTVATLADGRVMVSWNSSDAAAPSLGHGMDVSARILSVSDLATPLPPPAPLTLTVADASAVEERPGGTWAAFEVFLSRDAAQPVTVSYATADGAALAGSDYDATSGTLSFALGETRKTVWVRVNDDSRSEGDEHFSLTLSAPTGGATIADGEASVTIHDDEPAPYFMSVADAAPVREGNTGQVTARFIVTLDRAADAPISVNYGTRDGTASSGGSGSDYQSAYGTITFAAGETSKVISVAVTGDKAVEADETFTLLLDGAPDSVIVTRPEATGTIVNDDVNVTPTPPMPPVVDTDGDPLFDAVFYMASNPDVLAAGLDARTHYINHGWKEGRDPNAVFDTDAYLAANRDVAAAGINPLEHYRTSGVHEGRDVSLHFDGALYLAAHKDVAAAGLDPLLHYLTHGLAEGRQTFAAVGNLTANGFDSQFYLMSNRDVAASGLDAETHFRQFGVNEGRNPNSLFDAKGYLEHNVDVAAAGMNPLDHFMSHGWRENREGGVHFDTAKYLAANADVAAAGVNPLLHYLEFGLAEGRIGADDGIWG